MPLSLFSKHLTMDTLVDIDELWAHWTGMYGNLGHLFCTPVVVHAWMCGMEIFVSLLGAAVWQCPLQLFRSSAFAAVRVQTL